QLRVLRVMAVQLDEKPLDVVRRLDRGANVARKLRCRHIVSLAREIAQERIPQGRIAEPPLQRGAGAARFGKAIDRALRLQSEQELDLPELVRLKAAGRVQPFAKAE